VQTNAQVNISGSESNDKTKAETKIEQAVSMTDIYFKDK
jgi:hypothetical protein